MIFSFTPSPKGKEREREKGMYPEKQSWGCDSLWKGGTFQGTEGKCQVFSKHWINAGQSFVVTWPYCFQIGFPTGNC